MGYVQNNIAYNFYQKHFCLRRLMEIENENQDFTCKFPMDRLQKGHTAMIFNVLFANILILAVRFTMSAEIGEGNYLMQFQEVDDNEQDEIADPELPQFNQLPQLFDYDANKDLESDTEEGHDRNTRKQLHNLCETLTEIIPNIESGHEFKPLFYTNTTCASAPNVDPFRHKDHTKEFCYLRSGLTRSCQTKFKEFTFFKRKLTEGCWHPEPRLVAIGCDCNVGFKYYH